MPDPYDESVEREMMRGENRLVCAWHPRYFAAEKIMREGVEPTSHSICEDCREKFNDAFRTDLVRAGERKPIRGNL